MKRRLRITLLALCVTLLATGVVFAAARLGLGNPNAAVGSGPAGGQSGVTQSQDPQSHPRFHIVSSATPTVVCNCVAERLNPLPPAPQAPYFGPPPAPAGGIPNISGQLLLVSVTQEWLWAYQDRHLVFATPVTTGMPQLPTPTGIFQVMSKVSDVTFYSPWPPGSPYYYPPEHVNYALLFLSGGFFIHDAPWRHCFGPGTNVPHTCPDGAQETGSHGCVNTPTSSGAWLYGWAPVGATVDIVG